MREWAIRFALLFGAPAAVLLLLESALRMTDSGFDPRFFVSIDEGRAVATNDKFGWRYFPRPLARTPVPARVETPKPPGSYRVFVLGESAAMGFPDPAVGLAPMLRSMLGPRAEVVNAAMTAIDSGVIVEIAREAARLQPDAFVVMMGNNEVVGPHGPGSAAAARWSWMQTTRTGQWIAHWARPPAGPREWRGMEMFLDRQVAADDPRLALVHRNFERNLEAIVAAGTRAGARVIVSTVPVNLRECPPFASPDGKAAAAFQAGRYEEARDLDALRFRADSRIEAIIRRVGARATLVEPAIPDDLFYEHVHLRPEGNYRLARAIAEKLAPDQTPPEQEEVYRRIALTSWDRRRMEERIVALMERPPFRGANRGKLASLKPDPAGSRAQYEAAMREAPSLDLRIHYAEFLRETGDPNGAIRELRVLDSELPGRKAILASLGSALVAANRPAEALSAFAGALALDPGFDLALLGQGIAFERAGDQAAARRAYEASIESNLDFLEARLNLGLMLGRAGDLAGARAQFEEAGKRRPDSAAAAYQLGMTAARMGDPESAARALETAARLDERDADARYDLGVVLARLGRDADAAARYREAILIDPRHADAHNNLGSALARRGDFQGAAGAFAKALEIRPEFPAARRNLDLARKAMAR